MLCRVEMLCLNMCDRMKKGAPNIPSIIIQADVCACVLHAS